MYLSWASWAFLFSSVVSGLPFTFLFINSNQRSLTIWFRWSLGLSCELAATSLFCFLFSHVVGLYARTVWISVLVCQAPLHVWLILSKSLRKLLAEDFRRFWGTVTVRGALQVALAGAVTLYTAHLALFTVEGEPHTMIDNVWGDFPFHLYATTSFAFGQNFPPHHPEYFGAFFTYPWLVDFIPAMMVAIGGPKDLWHAFAAEYWLLSAVTIYMLYKFYFHFTGDSKPAAVCSVLFLCYNGGLCFLDFFQQHFLVQLSQHAFPSIPPSTFPWGYLHPNFLFSQDLRNYLGVVLHTLRWVPRDFSVRWGSSYHFGNTIIALFMPQRSFLLGFPLAFGAYTIWWTTVFSPSQSEIKKSEFRAPVEALFANILPRIKSKMNGLPFLPTANAATTPLSLSLMALAGVSSGLLALSHSHTYIVLFSVFPLLALFTLRTRWMDWLTFAAVLAAVTLPQAAYVILGQRMNHSFGINKSGLPNAGQAVTETSSPLHSILKVLNPHNFFHYQPGWEMVPQENFVTYWLKNTGLVIPLVLASMLFLYERTNEKIDGADSGSLGGPIEAEFSGSLLRLGAYSKRACENRTAESCGKSETKASEEQKDSILSEQQTFRNPFPNADTPTNGSEAKHLEKPAGAGAEERPPPATGGVTKAMLLFYLPFTMWFVIPNLFRLSPWMWDNIKFLLSWYALSVPFAAMCVASLWKTCRVPAKTIAVLLFVLLVLGGVVDTTRVYFQNRPLKIYNDENMFFAVDVLYHKTEADALILRKPNHIHYSLISGRITFMGYTGHVVNHGIECGERMDFVDRVYRGRMSPKGFVSKFPYSRNIYAIVGHEERENYGQKVANLFSKCPLVHDEFNWKLFNLTAC